LVEEVTKRKRSFRDFAANGDVNALQAALEDGIDVNCRSDYGTTALHKAASSGHAEAVELLLAYGADTTLLAPREGGITPLMEAIKYGHHACEEILRAREDCGQYASPQADVGTVENAKRLASFSQDAAFFLDDDDDSSDSEDAESASNADHAGKRLFLNAMEGKQQQERPASATGNAEVAVEDKEDDGFVLLDAQSESAPSTGYAIFTDIFVFVNPSSGGNCGQQLTAQKLQTLYDASTGERVVLGGGGHTLSLQGGGGFRGTAGGYTGEGVNAHFYNLKSDEKAAGLARLRECVQAQARGEGSVPCAVAAGGDGTVKWMISELAGIECPQVPLGVIPFGTGNDMSRVLGWGGHAPQFLGGSQLFSGERKLRSLKTLLLKVGIATALTHCTRTLHIRYTHTLHSHTTLTHIHYTHCTHTLIHYILHTCCSSLRSPRSSRWMCGRW
jgi:hypothetical protein